MQKQEVELRCAATLERLFRRGTEILGIFIRAPETWVCEARISFCPFTFAFVKIVSDRAHEATTGQNGQDHDRRDLRL